MDKLAGGDHLFLNVLPMKLFFFLTFAALAAGPVLAAQPSPSHATNGTIPKSHISQPVATGALAPVTGKAGTAGGPMQAPSAPATAKPASASLTLDAYVAALASDVPLSKDEQTDVKTYYLDDGAKLQDILNDASLSPFAQMQQVDALRDTRNAKIVALLDDAGRAAKFGQVESDYRVALVELAAQGGLVPGSRPPNVPEPTATTPAQAEKATPGISRQAAVPGT
jgi:hypothetical protein